jgi:cellulose synthase/poly-beta-1,6-N-acetylglucosamine synthase-like glycosyltransferase
MIATTLFWCSLFLLIYTFAGYPLFLRFLNLVSRRKRPIVPAATSSGYPSVSFLIVARNESTRIAARLQNLAECPYPGDREIVLVCDACEDDTAERAQGGGLTIPVTVVPLAERSGKSSALNTAAGVARGDIFVFADARQRFDPGAVEAMVSLLLQHPEAAAVSGSLEIEPSTEGAAAGMDAYWRLEKWIRNEESRWDSVIGCTGAIYAMRREDFHPIPPDTLIDDVVVPMQALVRGRRILFEPAAVAYDPQTLETHHEKRRKTRTLAGNYQMLFRYPGWLLPWVNRAWWQLLSHKYLRLGGPLYLAGCLAGALVLAPSSLFYQLALAAQLLAYLAGFAGMTPWLRRFRILSIPAGFLFLQVQSAKAFLHYLKLRFRPAGGAW